MFMRWADTSNRMGDDAGSFTTTDSDTINFASLVKCSVHYSPQTLRDPEERKILGGVIDRGLKTVEAALCLQGKLIVGPTRLFWRDRGNDPMSVAA